MKINTMNKEFAYGDYINKIYFYMNGVVVLSVSGAKNIKAYALPSEKKQVAKSNYQIEEITLSFLRKANKVKLNSKKNFYVRSNRDYQRKEYDIYINCNSNGEVSIENLGEYIISKKDGVTEYRTAYRVTMQNPFGTNEGKKNSVVIVGEKCRFIKSIEFVERESIAMIMSKILKKEINEEDVAELKKALNVGIKTF